MSSLIGKQVVITTSTQAELVGKRGLVTDETQHTWVIDINHNPTRLLKSAVRIEEEHATQT